MIRTAVESTHLAWSGLRLLSESREVAQTAGMGRLEIVGFLDRRLNGGMTANGGGCVNPPILRSRGGMMGEFLIDGMLSGTGVRDAIKGGYVDSQSIGLSKALALDLAAWQRRYEEAHFAGFPPESITQLDNEGMAFASRAADELPKECFGYFSHGRTTRLT